MHLSENRSHSPERAARGRTISQTALMAHDRRFRFGAQLHQPLPDMSWAESARRLEELGYSTLFVPDHFGDQLAPIAAMTAAAAATTSLVVGALVFDNDYRHPVVLAKEMATIDLLFPGRCEVGLGAGWMRTDYDASGIVMDRPGVRVDRLMEGAAVIRGLWSGEPVDHRGEHYTITDLVGLPAPHTAGGPPLLLAGGSPRMLRFAGATADIVGVNPSIHSGEVDADAARDGLADRMDAKLGWVREGRAPASTTWRSTPGYRSLPSPMMRTPSRRCWHPASGSTARTRPPCWTRPWSWRAPCRS